MGLSRGVTRSTLRASLSRVIGSDGGASGGGSLIPASLRQLLYPGNQPAYYTEEQFPGYSHLLKDYSSGVGSLRPKRLGYCYDFDGVNDYVTAGRRVTTGSVTALTVCGWVKFAGTAEYTFAGEFRTGTGQRAWQIGTTASFPGKFNVDISTNGTFTTGHKQYTSTEDINDNAWHHVAFTFSSGTLELFLDGVSITPVKNIDNACPVLFNTTEPFAIGAVNTTGTPTNFSVASKYDFRVYEQVLTPDEVTYLYTNGQSGTDPGTDNLVAHYPLQEQSGTTAYDISGNGNHGTIINAVTSGVGSIHQPDAGVTKSYPNDAGYRALMGFDGVNDGVASPAFTLASNQPFQLKLKTIIPNITSYERLFEAVGFSFTLLKGSSGGQLSLNLAGTSHTFYANTVAEVISLEIRYTGTNLIVLDNDVEVLNVVRTYTGGTATAFNIGTGGGTRWKGLIFDVELYIDGVLNRAYSGAETAVWTDTSGNSRNGTVSGSPELVYIPAATATLDALGGTLTETGRVPQYGTALGYGWQGNGTNVYVDLGEPIIPATADFSVKIKIKTQATFGTTTSLFSAGTSSTGNRITLLINSAGRIWFFQSIGATNSTKQLNVNTWYDIQFDRVGENFLCYCDELLIATLAVGGDISTTVNTVIGRRTQYNDIYFPGVIGPVTITTGGVTTSFHPIPGTRDVAKVVSNAEGSVISNAVVNGVLADLYTIGNGSWRLPHIENGAHWDGTALYPAGPGQANAVNGEAINIPANVAPRGLLTDRTGGVIAPLDYAMGTDTLTDETFYEYLPEVTVGKRVFTNYADRYGASLSNIKDNAYFAGGSFDSDVAAYLSAVEVADGEALESGVADAINAFVVGCKEDGIWDAIKASCILAGARTLDGALVPLVGTAPTNANFVSGDYSRINGLTGNGSTKYLDTNRAGNADPQNDFHMSIYRTAVAGGVSDRVIGNSFLTGGNLISNNGTAFRCRNSTSQTHGTIATGFIGMSRDVGSQFTARNNGSSSVKTSASQTPDDSTITVYQQGLAFYNAGTFCWYSIGESLDLALLDARLTTLIAAIGTALA